MKQKILQKHENLWKIIQKNPKFHKNENFSDIIFLQCKHPCNRNEQL